MRSAFFLTLSFILVSHYSQAEYTIKKGKDLKTNPSGARPPRTAPSPTSRQAPRYVQPSLPPAVPPASRSDEAYESRTMSAINSLYQWMKTSRVETGEAGNLEHLIRLQGALRDLTYNLKNCLSSRDTFLRTRAAQLGRYKPTQKLEDLNVQTISRGLAAKVSHKRQDMEKNVLYYGPTLLPALKQIVGQSTDLEVLNSSLGLLTLLTDGEIETCISQNIYNAKAFFFEYALPKEQVKACRG